MTRTDLNKIIDERINIAIMLEKTGVVDNRERLATAIRSLKKKLSFFELNMLNTLNQHCLLLDVREEIEIKDVFIKAYNLENELILVKRVDF